MSLKLPVTWHKWCEGACYIRLDSRWCKIIFRVVGDMWNFVGGSVRLICQGEFVAYTIENVVTIGRQNADCGLFLFLRPGQTWVFVNYGRWRISRGNHRRSRLSEISCLPVGGRRVSNYLRWDDKGSIQDHFCMHLEWNFLNPSMNHPLSLLWKWEHKHANILQYLPFFTPQLDIGHLLLFIRLIEEIRNICRTAK